MEWLNDPGIQLLGVLLITTLLFVYVVRRALAHFSHKAKQEAKPEHRAFWLRVVHAALAPLTLLIWYYAVYATIRVMISRGWLPANWDGTEAVFHEAAGIGVAVAILWFMYRVACVVETHFAEIAHRTPSKLDNIFLPLLGTSLRLMVPVVGLFLVVRLFPLSDNAADLVQKLLAIVLISALTWVLRRGIILVEGAFIRDQDFITGANFHTRALATRVRVLRKIAVILLMAFAVATILMLFPHVRHVGQSILASAGIAGIVLGFAAQKTLGNVLAGIQIALTQPIRIGDLVLVENDLGNIEEITLTFVVLRTWDLRRLVLPISYFVDKPIQNWTRSSENLLSPITIRVDFTLPVASFREHMRKVIGASKFWDRKVFSVQVVDADGGSMFVRILGSAAGQGESWNLQCELREAAYAYLTQEFPQGLPNFRPDRKAVGSGP